MFVIPKSIRLFVLAFALLFTFASCDNELMQDEITPEFVGEEELPDLLIEALPPSPDTDPSASPRRRACFRFIYPVELVLRNGTNIIANDAQDLRAAVAGIRNSRVRANFVYPFDVELANGEQVTIRTFLGLRRLHRACRGLDEAPSVPCITINYPIEVINGDSTFTVNSAAELVAADRALRPRGVSIVYPIEVTFAEDGRVVSVNGDRELRRLRAFCNSRGEDDDRGESCYRIVYPVDLNIGGVQFTVVSREGWRRLIRLRANRPNVEVSIIYPITLIDRESGEEVLIEDRDAWEAAREDCE